MLSLKNISAQFGLSDKFLRRCINALKDELQPYQTRGEHNTILFKTASSGIFEQIKIHKENGLSVPEIAKAIQKNLASLQPPTPPKNVVKQEGKTRENVVKPGGGTMGNVENDLVQQLMSRLEKSEQDNHSKDLQILNQEKEALQNRLKSLEGNMLLLTDGSTDINTFIKNNAEVTAKRKLIVDQLKETSFWSFRRRKKLLNSLEATMV
ncbi:MAG: hypothetical protein H8E98_05170 [Bacteroidetes bacterium]|nr:hypothetical protein [Bacteroidota bacterium]